MDERTVKLGNERLNVIKPALKLKFFFFVID